MDQQQQQLIDRIKQAQNILVSVSSNPSVDQLAAAIGLTLVLNKLNKHGTAVFSGQVPNTLEFLKPEETLEKNTDSLRDFIIALDKSKADKLRYKVEDQVVRIFITPYKTSLSDKDLEFSQGDFNVDVVVALGVTDPQDLDSAITAHGRILHDATVVSVSTEGQGSLGSINWVDPAASSLSEMVVSLADALDKKAMDSQVATALLTGIVATTDRFRNEKTSPKTMSASAELMAAGANQQLIATELETAPEPVAVAEVSTEKTEDAQPQDGKSEPKEADKPQPGTLEIEHEADDKKGEAELQLAADEKTVDQHPQVEVDEEGQLKTLGHEEPAPQISKVRGVSTDGTTTEVPKTEVSHERVTTPPKVDEGDLTANSAPEELDPDTEELSLPTLQEPMLSHTESVLPKSTSSPAAPLQPAPANWQPPTVSPISPDETLHEIEQSVSSPHLQADEPSKSEDTEVPAAVVDSARSAVDAAYNSSSAPANPLAPIAALNAQPLGPELRTEEATEPPSPPAAAPFSAPSDPAVSLPVTNTGFSEPTPGNTPADDALDMPLPSNPFPTPQGSVEQFQNPQSFPSSVTPPAPSAFPGAPQQGSGSDDGQLPPPPVPPPMVPRMQ